MESFSGTVVRGKQLGRTIGFPTANLDTAASPAGGVYAVAVTAKGERYRGIMNVGSHPTAPEGAPTVEVHLTEPMKRERFRHVSFVKPASIATFAGLGFGSYSRAIRFLAERGRRN